MVSITGHDVGTPTNTIGRTTATKLPPLPPMGKKTFACTYTSKRNSGTGGHATGPITMTPIAGSPINMTPISLPPMGQRQYSARYTSKKNSGNVVYVFNPCGYTPSSQEENHPSFGKYTRVQLAIDIPQVVLGSYYRSPETTSSGRTVTPTTC